MAFADAIRSQQIRNNTADETVDIMKDVRKLGAGGLQNGPELSILDVAVYRDTDLRPPKSCIRLIVKQGEPETQRHKNLHCQARNDDY